MGMAAEEYGSVVVILTSYHRTYVLHKWQKNAAAVFVRSELAPASDAEGSAAPAQAGMRQQPLLAADRRLIVGRLAADVATIAAQLTRPLIVVQLGFEHAAANVGADAGIFDREEGLDPPIQVTGHQVGAAQVDLGIAAVLEIINAAVLEEAPDDAGHADVLADPRHARPQAADAAHDQIDLDARPARPDRASGSGARRPGRSS